MQQLKIISALMALKFLSFSCADNSFQGGANKLGKKAEKPPSESSDSISTPSADVDVVGSGDGSAKLSPRECVGQLAIPGKSNIYLSGTTNQSISYNKGRPDRSQSEAPVDVTPVDPTCLKSGAFLVFNVTGTISHHAGGQGTSADGSFVTSHERGSVLGKSNISAPINSLIGVFLADGDPSQNPSPAPLDFSTPAKMNYANLSPAIGQVFFIGDGLRADNSVKGRVKVPEGSKHLYLGIMDIYEWNNNTGQLMGGYSILE